MSLTGANFTPEDTVLVLSEPTRNSIDVAHRLAAIASRLSARVLIVANRVQSAEQERTIRAALEGYELMTVPEDPGITAADRDGVAPIDASPDSPGVVALTTLATQLRN